MTKNDRVRFVIVGSGHIGKRHAAMIEQNPNAELVALCDIRPREELALEQYQVDFFPSIDALLDSSLSYDVVTICSPNGCHTEQAIKALKKGKHVVCEKPLGLTKASVEEVLYYALQVSKLVFVVMQNRYSPPAAWIKDVVDRKILGDIYLVQLNCYWNRDERYYRKGLWKGIQELDGGTLFTQFSHFVDIMYWLFGDITNIQAKFNDFSHRHLTDFEDSGFVSFDFVKGGMGSINYSTAVWNSNLESSMTIIGSRGSVKIGGQYMDKIEMCNISDYNLPELPPVSPAHDYGDYKGSAANHHFVIENVVETLRGKKTITTNALEGLKVVEIIERIYKLRDDKLLKRASR